MFRQCVGPTLQTWIKSGWGDEPREQRLQRAAETRLGDHGGTGRFPGYVRGSFAGFPDTGSAHLSQ